MATVTVYTNKDGATKNNMLVSEDGYVLRYDKSRTNTQLNGCGNRILYFKIKKSYRDAGNKFFTLKKEILPSINKEAPAVRLFN